LLEVPVEVKNGQIAVPSLPGVGLVVNEKRLAEFEDK
jgi:L-alanine-DL-glutamate epimerase-like enolase superfamily enzyme